MSANRSIETYIQSVEQQIVSCEQQLHTLRQHLMSLREEFVKESRLRSHVSQRSIPKEQVMENHSPNPHVTPEKRFLRMKDVCQATGLARSTIYRMMEDKEFPRAVQLSGRSVAWIKSEVDDWVERLINYRDTRSS